MPEPTPPLDLADIESRCAEVLALLADETMWHHEAYAFVDEFVPALVARVRALEAEVEMLRAMLPPPPPPVNRPEQAHIYWRTHRTGPNRGDKPCRRCSTLMRDVAGNKQYCSPACQQADARDGYGRGPYSWS